MKRAQVWSTDFVISVTVFLMAFFFAMLIWNNMGIQSAEQSKLGDMQKKVLHISDSIIRTAGIPPEWNETTVESVGLSSGTENVLDPAKVSSFISLLNNSYDRARSLMGLDVYNIYFEIDYVNGTVIANTSTPVVSGNNNIMSITRHCIYGGRPVRAVFILWDEEV